MLIRLPGRYNREAPNEQSGKGKWVRRNKLCLDLTGHLGHIHVNTQYSHLQKLCRCDSRSQVHLTLSWSRICCRIQGWTAEFPLSNTRCDHCWLWWRYCKEYINMGGNHLFETTLRYIMETSLIRPLVKVLERPLCMRLLGGERNGRKY